MDVSPLLLRPAALQQVLWLLAAASVPTLVGAESRGVDPH
jgi:hypothetical protein